MNLANMAQRGNVKDKQITFSVGLPTVFTLDTLSETHQN